MNKTRGFDKLPVSIQTIIVSFLDLCCEDADNPLLRFYPYLAAKWKRATKYSAYGSHYNAPSTCSPTYIERIFLYGRLHRLVEHLLSRHQSQPDKDIVFLVRWYNHRGLLHRNHDLPASYVIDEKRWPRYSSAFQFKPKGYGYTAWYKNGRVHRDGNRPAVIFDHGELQYWVNGRLVHRQDPPRYLFQAHERRCQEVFEAEDGASERLIARERKQALFIKTHGLGDYTQLLDDYHTDDATIMALPKCLKLIDSDNYNKHASIPGCVCF